MASSDFVLDTAQALRYVGIDRKQWDHMMQRKNYAAAPPVEAGHPRYFARDDLVCLFVLDHYLRLGVGPTLAGRVAGAFATELRKGGEDLVHLYVVLTGNRVPIRVMACKPPGPIISHEFPVAEIRQKIEQYAAERGLGDRA